ncbi:hypothetical protein HET69_29010 [Streptomyces sp. CJ_13]|uniref:hypothetical protein n=1 Tax=Streptomyces sp. CJ_13 TaxID=2724943 RepID=UPI001BDD370C|nr:hypothetical protein [Streptomyces sp. CJ_13]MBT1187916.1 hypothetical protein [Streptomyces sp. CJ_13]
MLDQKEAQQRAAMFLAERSRSWPSDNVRLIPEYCFIDRGRFIAPYDRVEFLDGGDEDAQLAGNLPVSVDLATGECSFITWAEAHDLMDRGLL